MKDEDFECTADVSFWKQGSMACQADECNGMINSCKLHREIWTGNDTVTTSTYELCVKDRSIISLFFPEYFNNIE